MAAINDYSADRAEQTLSELQRHIDAKPTMHHETANLGLQMAQAQALVAIAHAMESIAAQLGRVDDKLEAWHQEGVPVKEPHNRKK